jgi:MscS family membrane protein
MGVSQVPSWLGSHQILFSILISVAAVVFIWRVDTLLARYTTVSSQTVQDIRTFRAVATATVAVVAISWIVNQPLPTWIADPFETVGGPQAVDGIVEFLPQFVVSESEPLLVTLLGFWWVWVMRAKGDEIIERFVAAKYDETLAPIVENVWDVTIAAALVLLILDQWGINPATLLAPAGVIGIIVGFSARETVANFFGSISLYADDTYKRGDFIELDSGVSGTVRDISVRSTVLQTLDGDLVTIPNSRLNEGKIVNKSSPRPDRRINSRIGVSYDADPERVTDILHEAAEPVSEQREPEVHLRSFGDSALVFEVFVWIAAPDDKLAAEHELNVALYRALDDAGIEIPYPQRDITVERESELRS